MKEFKTNSTLADNLKVESLNLSQIRKYFQFTVFVVCNNMVVGERLTMSWRIEHHSFYIERVK